MPRSSAYDQGRYAFLSGKSVSAAPRETIDETIDWISGFEREAASLIHYRESVCHAAGNIR